MPVLSSENKAGGMSSRNDSRAQEVPNALETFLRRAEAEDREKIGQARTNLKRTRGVNLGKTEAGARRKSYPQPTWGPGRVASSVRGPKRVASTSRRRRPGQDGGLSSTKMGLQVRGLKLRRRRRRGRGRSTYPRPTWGVRCVVLS